MFFGSNFRVSGLELAAPGLGRRVQDVALGFEAQDFTWPQYGIYHSSKKSESRSIDDMNSRCFVSRAGARLSFWFLWDS